MKYEFRGRTSTDALPFEYNLHEIAVGKQIAQDGGKCGAAGTHMQREDEMDLKILNTAPMTEPIMASFARPSV